MKLSLVRKIKPLIFLILVFPSFYWFILFISGGMGINPIDSLIRELGNFALRIIILTLLISPLSIFKPLKNIVVLRRMIGLFAFYYMTLHLSSYVVLDHYFNWDFLFKDIYIRPFISLGFFSFILTLPLAFTSNNIMLKKLRYKTWKNIHRLIYIIAPIASLHYYLLTKADKTEPLIYLIIIFILLIFRVIIYFSKKESSPK